MLLNKYDEHVLKFLEDAINILKEYDREIYGKLSYSKHDSMIGWKGIGKWSITEPVIKFLIYLGLCEKYILYPEKPYSIDPKKHMDLAIYLSEDDYLEEDDPELDVSPIAIEIKWSGITKKKKQFDVWTIKQLYESIKKLKLYSKSKNKYILQIGFYEKENFANDINIKRLSKSTINRMNGRTLRNLNTEIIKVFKFETEGEHIEGNQFKKYYFYFILWKM